jgi:hypothetical protein
MVAISSSLDRNVKYVVELVKERRGELNEGTLVRLVKMETLGERTIGLMEALAAILEAERKYLIELRSFGDFDNEFRYYPLDN